MRFSTRRRLIVAFAAVLTACVIAPAFQLIALRRMDRMFAALEEQEKRMHLALKLEDAVHDQYEHGARFVLEREGVHLDNHDAARGHALAIMSALTQRMPAQDAALWERRIHDGTAELARLFRDHPPTDVRPAPATFAHDQSYAVVLMIEESIHDYFGQLQQATTAFRRELVALERATLRWTVLLLVVAVAFAAATVLYLSRSVARPLALLSDGAAAIASGDLDTRIELRSPDEFGALAARFNAMTVALKRHQERSVEAEKLAGIGRAAAGIAHELNNPLQVMLGYLSLNRDIDDRRLAAQLAAAEEEALRCKTIVDGMLELSRPASRPKSAIELRELCVDVAGSIRGAGQHQGVELSVAGAGIANADRAGVRQVVFNLVKNAVEATAPTGRVAVEVRTRGESAEVVVSDTGPGLPPDVRPRIFEPFYTTKPDGTGLGLAVSRAIAQAQGGDIDVRNGEGAGAIFTLRLPRATQWSPTT